MALNLDKINNAIGELDEAKKQFLSFNAEIAKTTNELGNAGSKTAAIAELQIASIDKVLQKIQVAKRQVSGAIDAAISENFPSSEVEKNLNIAKQLERLRFQFVSAADADGIKGMSELSEVNKLQTYQAKIAEINSKLAAESQTLSQQKNANLLTEFAYKQKLAALHKQTSEQLQEQISQLEDFQTHTSAQVKQSAQSTIESTRLTQGVNEAQGEGITDAITRSSINSGLNQNLGKVFSGEMTFADMSKTIFADIQQNLMQEMMKNIAEIMTQMSMNLMQMVSEPFKKGLSSVFDSLFSNPDSMLGGLSNSIQGLVGQVNGLFGGFFSQLFKGTGGSFSSMFSSDGLSGLLSLVNTFFLADGGVVRGPGNETSDSIPAWLSDGEFVTRAAVVKQPGMLPFLHDVNTRGFLAVNDYARRVRHATGGIAGTPAALTSPSLGNVSLSEGTSKATTVENAVNLHVYDDPQRIINSSFSDGGMESYYLKIERNPQRLKSILGV